MSRVNSALFCLQHSSSSASWVVVFSMTAVLWELVSCMWASPSLLSCCKLLFTSSICFIIYSIHTTYALRYTPHAHSVTHHMCTPLHTTCALHYTPHAHSITHHMRTPLHTTWALICTPHYILGYTLITPALHIQLALFWVWALRFSLNFTPTLTTVNEDDSCN